MADGTAQNGTATVAGDEVTLENGVTVTARQVQRVKVDSVGTDGAVTDTSATNPFPIKPFGIYNSTAPTITNGNRNELQISSKGSLLVAQADPNGSTTYLLVANSDALSTANTGWGAIGFNTIFNGTTWDRMRGTGGALNVLKAEEATATFRGRATTFRAIGRAGTTPRRLLTIWNPVGSGKVVHLNQVAIDLVQTAIMAVTVIPPVIRIYKITAAPTGGTALTKVAKDNLLSSSASILLAGDASVDGTNSVTALAATTTAGAALTQEFAPRLITAAGYEPADRIELLDDKDIVLRAGEGVCLSLDLTLATQDPATSNWVATIDWYETN